MYENLSLIYDSYMQDVDYEKWADYLTEIIKNNNLVAKTVLEYGCGSGNLTLPLSKKFNIVGVDLSDEMLSLAEAKLRKTGTELFKGDLRYFEFNKKFDAIILACDTLTMFDYEDIEVFFNRVYDQLNPGGIFLFDILSKSYLKDFIAQNNFIFDDDNVYFTWTSEDFENYIESYFTFFIKEGNGYQRVDDYQKQFILDIEILKKLLKQSGFDFIKTYDFLTNNEVNNKTDRIQFVAVKPK